MALSRNHDNLMKKFFFIVASLSLFLSLLLSLSTTLSLSLSVSLSPSPSPFFILHFLLSTRLEIPMRMKTCSLNELTESFTFLRFQGKKKDSIGKTKFPRKMIDNLWSQSENKLNYKNDIEDG